VESLLNHVDIFRKGAEANLYLAEGRLLKERVSKAYRIPALDGRLRRQRTRSEARNLERAADAGVRVPKLLRCDERNFTLEMEYVEGDLVKALFDGGQRIGELSEEIGGILRRLHDNSLVHNDLTTSNLISCPSGVCVIDFGLAYHTTRLEDKAMDLVVFKKSIQASHTKDAERIWESLLSGYNPDKETLARVKTIESRVRYK
jgi:Kae1-associated kinase Bud32